MFYLGGLEVRGGGEDDFDAVGKVGFFGLFDEFAFWRVGVGLGFLGFCGGGRQGFDFLLLFCFY